MDMLKIQDAIGQWARKTFPDGPGRIFGTYNHLCKEWTELRLPMLSLHCSQRWEGTQVEQYIEEAKEEVVDCLILLMDMANALGLDSEQAVLEKMEINKKRKWGPPDENGVVEHIR